MLRASAESGTVRLGRLDNVGRIRRLDNVANFLGRRWLLAMVSTPGDPGTHRRRPYLAFLPGNLFTLFFAVWGGVFDLGIHLGADQKSEARHVKPEHQNHPGTDCAVG